MKGEPPGRAPLVGLNCRFVRRFLAVRGGMRGATVELPSGAGSVRGQGPARRRRIGLLGTVGGASPVAAHDRPWLLGAFPFIPIRRKLAYETG